MEVAPTATCVFAMGISAEFSSPIAERSASDDKHVFMNLETFQDRIPLFYYKPQRLRQSRHEIR